MIALFARRTSIQPELYFNIFVDYFLTIVRMGKFTVPEKVLYVCTGDKCGKRGGKDMLKIGKAYARHYREKGIEVIETECTDRCKFAPVCAIQPGNTWLKEYKEKEVLKLLGLI